MKKSFGIYHPLPNHPGKSPRGKSHYSSRPYGEIITLCESAIALAPFEETLHKNLTSAYLCTGQNNKALLHYQYVTELFYRKLGVNISENLRDLYRQITKTVHKSELDLMPVHITATLKFLKIYTVFKLGVLSALVNLLLWRL